MLLPNLWDKTLPFDGSDFKLEFMDLDEFLNENYVGKEDSMSASLGSMEAPSPQVPAPASPMHQVLNKPPLSASQSPQREYLLMHCWSTGLYSLCLFLSLQQTHQSTDHRAQGNLMLMWTTALLHQISLSQQSQVSGYYGCQSYRILLYYFKSVLNALLKRGAGPLVTFNENLKLPCRLNNCYS